MCWLIFNIKYHSVYLLIPTEHPECVTCSRTYCKLCLHVHVVAVLYCSFLSKCTPAFYTVRKQQLSHTGLATLTFLGLNAFENLSQILAGSQTTLLMDSTLILLQAYSPHFTRLGVDSCLCHHLP